MPLLYDLGVRSYRIGIGIASLFKPKARAWIDGRKGIWKRIDSSDVAGCIWMHCASVGEFEQGLPVLERLKNDHPERKLLVTFFSPSGYNAKKDHPIADLIEYLPLDTGRNARRFVDHIKPSMALFVKYEFWFHYLQELREQGVPSYLVSGIFRASQPFFKWYGGTHRKMLRFFERVFVQNKASAELLKSIEVECEITGDTRFDRVLRIADEAKDLPLGKAFERASDNVTLVAGSTWSADEEHLLKAMAVLSKPLRLIIAPHELGASRLDALEKALPSPRDRWSHLESMIKGLFNPKDAGYPEPKSSPNGDPLDVFSLLVDRMGLLSIIYRYGDIAYVGGGFGSGIHNTLEAAAHGKPVLFGPNHKRFAEAQGLIEAGAGWCVNNAEELQRMLQQMIDDPQGLRTASKNARSYVQRNAGATDRIVGVLRLRL